MQWSTYVVTCGKNSGDWLTMNKSLRRCIDVARQQNKVHETDRYRIEQWYFRRGEHGDELLSKTNVPGIPGLVDA